MGARGREWRQLHLLKMLGQAERRGGDRGDKGVEWRQPRCLRER